MLAATDISIIHSVLLTLLPTRLGDLYYPVLLRRLSIPVGRAITSLSLLRLFDAAVLGTMFVLAAVSTAAFPKVGLPEALIAVGLLLLGALIALALLPKLCAWLAMLALRWRSPRMREVARQALDGRRWLNGLPFHRRLELFGLTILYWVGSTSMVWLVIESLGIKLMAAQAAFVASGLSLAGAVPLQTIAGFGVAEASLTLLLVIVGFPSIEAASIGVVARFGLLALPIAVAALWLPPRWTFLHWKVAGQ